jgi:hypothetical protein
VQKKEDRSKLMKFIEMQLRVLAAMGKTLYLTFTPSPLISVPGTLRVPTSFPLREKITTSPLKSDSMALEKKIRKSTSSRDDIA